MTPEELTLAKGWADARLRALGLAPLGERHVVKRGPVSLVWRQQTATGQDVYFKAVPPLFAQEPPLTVWLSGRWPSNLPHVLATDPHRRWMLTRAVEGIALSDLDAVEPWMSAIRTLARIQIDSVGRAAELLDCGCPARDAGSLPDEFDLLLSETLPLCASRGAVVPDEVVRALHARRDDLCADAALLSASRVPTTLVHGDFVAGNVIVPLHNAPPVIIDWTDGALSHPFLDLLIFLRGRAAGRVAAHKEALVHAYLSEWAAAGAGSINDLHETFAVAQRLAPFYHAGSYRRIFAIDAAAVTEFAELVPWLLGLLSRPER